MAKVAVVLSANGISSQNFLFYFHYCRMIRPMSAILFLKPACSLGHCSVCMYLSILCIMANFPSEILRLLLLANCLRSKLIKFLCTQLFRFCVVFCFVSWLSVNNELDLIPINTFQFLNHINSIFFFNNIFCFSHILYFYNLSEYMRRDLVARLKKNI